MSGVVRLFVYGSLMQGSSVPEALRFHQEATFLERGSLPGRLYALDGYPGAIYDSANREERIHGEIWRMHDPDATLAWLDGYEGCSPADAEPHEFVRRILPVAPEEDYHLACHVYLYNRFVDGRTLIPSGRWV